MKIEVIGNKCYSCNKYTQYYKKNHVGDYERIDCGFCGQRQCKTRPGSRCRQYYEGGNAGMPL